MMKVFQKLKEAADKTRHTDIIPNIKESNVSYALLDHVFGEGLMYALEKGETSEQDIEKLLNNSTPKYGSISEIVLDREASSARLQLQGKVTYSVSYDQEKKQVHITEEYAINQATREGSTKYTGVDDKPMMKAKVEYAVSHGDFGEHGTLSRIPATSATLEHLECKTLQPSKSDPDLPKLFQPKTFIEKVKAFAHDFKEAISRKTELERPHLI